MSDIQFAIMLNLYGSPEETPFSDFVESAVLAEELGFAGLHAIDHFFLIPERVFSHVVDDRRPAFLEHWTAMSAIAARTSKVKIGPLVSPVSLRHPAFLARMGATLDRVSNGRHVLALGAGWNQREFEAYGFPFDEKFSVRYQKMIEGVQVIDKLWTENGPVDYEGTYYQLRQAPFWPKPVQKPRPPIWFGGTGQKVREAVARYGDGWAPAAPHYTGLRPEFYQECLEQIRARMVELGRDPRQLTPGALFFTVVAEKSQDAWDQAEILHKRQDWAPIPLEEIARLGIAIIGDPDECAAHLQRYVEAGVRYFVLSFVPFDQPTTRRGLRLFAEQVIPRVQVH